MTLNNITKKKSRKPSLIGVGASSDRMEKRWNGYSRIRALAERDWMSTAPFPSSLLTKKNLKLYIRGKFVIAFFPFFVLWKIFRFQRGCYLATCMDSWSVRMYKSSSLLGAASRSADFWLRAVPPSSPTEIDLHIHFPTATLLSLFFHVH